METREIVNLILHDRDGRILLQQRDEDAPTYPALWCLFGGGIDPGETPEQALTREAWEELRYRPQAPRLLCVRPYEDARYGKMGHHYCFLEACSDKRSLRLGEGQGMGWLRLDEMAGLPFIERDWAIVHEEVGPVLAQLTRNPHSSR